MSIAGCIEKQRGNVVDVGDRSISVQESLASSWTLAEQVGYKVIRERHKKGKTFDTSQKRQEFWWLSRKHALDSSREARIPMVETQPRAPQTENTSTPTSRRPFRPAAKATINEFSVLPNAKFQRTVQASR